VTRRRALIVTLALLAAALLVGLGMWQVQRRAWKLDLIARTEARLKAEPVAPPARAAWPAIDRDDAYTRLRLSGRWRGGRPTLVKAVTELGPGWWVLNALDTTQGTIVVNRGFVPDAARASVHAPQGGAVVTGLLRISEPGGAFLRHNDPGADRWFSRDVTKIAQARGWGEVAPFFVDAEASNSPGWPRGGLTVVRFPNNHLVYALTWLSLAGLAVGFAWTVARTPREAQAPGP
jgi:surfeit locus 1 family protein